MNNENNVLPDNPSIQVLKAGQSGIFTNYIYKAIPLAFDESMSYYETLLGLLNYLKNVVIPTVNNNANAVAELQNLYIELKTYVDEYFTNLDVQQEINNKLDAMVEDGSLTLLIKNYVDPIYQEYENTINARVNQIDTKVDSVASGSPLVASSTSEMTDTSHIYVNTTDGKWYYYDGDSWEIGGTYQATQIGNGSVTPLKTNFMDQINLIPETDYKNDYVLNFTTGAEQSYSGGSYSTNYVPIKDNVTKIVALGKDSAGLHIYFYNNEYTYLSQVSTSDMAYVNIPDNSKYFRVAFTLQYGCGNYILMFLEDYINCQNIYNNGKLKDKYINMESNTILYNKEKLNLLPKGYGAKQPTINGNTAYYNFTNTTSIFLGLGIKWNIKENDVLKLTFSGDYPMNSISLYNSNPNSASTGSAYNLNTQQSINNDKCEFTMTSELVSAINNKTLFLNYSIPSTEEETSYIYTIKVQINNDYYYFEDLVENYGIEEKTYKALFLGDSITALGGNNGWVAKFCNLLNINDYNNIAVSGAHLTDYSDSVYDGNPVHDGPDNNHNNVLGNQVQKIINNQATYVNPDIIMIAIGTNDGINTTLNDAYNQYYNNDRTTKDLQYVNRQTSAGAFRYCNEKLHELYPNAQIFWCTPIQASNQNRDVKSIINWGENLKILCSVGSYYCIDSEKCGINGLNETPNQNGEYLVDGLHLNNKGATVLSHYNASEVKRFLK